MTTKTNIPLIGAWVVLLLSACANPVSWENDLHVPVLDDRIRWGDVIPDSLYEASTDMEVLVILC